MALPDQQRHANAMAGLQQLAQVLQGQVPANFWVHAGAAVRDGLGELLQRSNLDPNLDNQLGPLLVQYVIEYGALENQNLDRNARMMQAVQNAYANIGPLPGPVPQPGPQPAPPQNPNQRHQQAMNQMNQALAAFQNAPDMRQVVGGLVARIHQLEAQHPGPVPPPHPQPVPQPVPPVNPLPVPGPIPPVNPLPGPQVPHGYTALAKVRVNNEEYLLFAHPSTDVVSVVQDPAELAVVFKARQYCTEGRRPLNPDVALPNFLFVYDEHQSNIANARELVVRYLAEVNPHNARASHFFASLVAKAGLTDNPLEQLRAAHTFLHPVPGQAFHAGLLEALQQQGNHVEFYAQPNEVITRVRQTVSEVIFYEAFETSRRNGSGSLGSGNAQRAVALFEEGLPFIGPNQEARYENELLYNRARLSQRRRR